jgi:hypothetical protein
VGANPILKPSEFPNSALLWVLVSCLFFGTLFVSYKILLDKALGLVGIITDGWLLNVF